MKITNITVKNFRSIEKASFDATSFMIMIGQNNTGKTNLFEAVEWFYNGFSKNTNVADVKYKRQNDLIISVEIEFDGVQHGLEKMTNDKNRETIKKLVGESETVKVIRESSDPKKRMFVIGEEKKGTGTGFDSALNDFLPKLEYVHTKQYHNEVAKYGKGSPITVMLGGVLSEILKENDQYKQFIQRFDELFHSDESTVAVKIGELAGEVKIHLEKQFPDTTKVEFSITPPQFEDLLKNFETEIDDGILTTADEKGDGMQRALMLSIIQTFAEYRRRNDESCKSFLFLIDEAELHLHPKAQRKLKAVLHELSTKGDQVFINTHSSVLISDNDADQQIYSVEKFEGATYFEQVGDNRKHEVVFDLLGGSPSDILFPLNILVVEGPSEVEFLRGITARFYPDKPKIQVIPARGDAFMVQKLAECLQKTYDILNNPIYSGRFVILVDKQPETAKAALKDFLAKNKDIKSDGRFFELDAESLEEAYPAPWKTIINTGDTGKKKIRLGKTVAEGISKAIFESEMKTIYDALCKSWEKAYGN